MADKYPFTENEIAQAYQTSIIDLVQQYGFNLKYEGKVFRVEGFGGLFIWNNGIGWYHGSTLEKGNNVEFLNKYCGINTKVEAIRLVLDYAHITPASELHRYEKKIEEKKDMILPEKDKTFNNITIQLIGDK